VELAAEVAEAYLRHAFDQMLAVAERVGEDRVNERPFGERTNSVTALITHCCGMTGWWLGTAALGRPSDRDRDAEFTASATLTELRGLVDATLRSAADDLRRLEAGEGTDGTGREHLDVGGPSDSSVVLHVVEELYQHLGHMELTADAFAAR